MIMTHSVEPAMALPCTQEHMGCINRGRRRTPPSLYNDMAPIMTVVVNLQCQEWWSSWLVFKGSDINSSSMKYDINKYVWERKCDKSCYLIQFVSNVVETVVVALVKRAIELKTHAPDTGEQIRWPLSSIGGSPASMVARHFELMLINIPIWWFSKPESTVYHVEWLPPLALTV